MFIAPESYVGAYDDAFLTRLKFRFACMVRPANSCVVHKRRLLFQYLKRGFPAAVISGPYEVHPGRQLLCFWKKEIIGPVGLSLFECSALQIG